MFQSTSCFIFYMDLDMVFKVLSYKLYYGCKYLSGKVNEAYENSTDWFLNKLS